MRVSHARNDNPEESLRGAVVQTDKRQDETTGGNTQTTFESLVQHGAEPDAGRFGLKSSVVNERNKNKSRLVNVEIDVDDLHMLDSGEFDGLAALGAEEVAIESGLVDITDGTAALLESGHLVLKDKIDAQDRFHGKREKTTVSAWAERVNEEEGDPRGGGNKTTDTRKVVQEVTAWPATDENTISLTREQIGKDKFLQSHVTVEEQGVLTDLDYFGASGCPTTTTRQKVALDFDPGDPTIDVVEQKLEHVDGFGKLFTKTVLNDGWPTLISYEEEPVTGVRVRVTRTVHGTEPTVALAGVPRYVDNVKHTGCDRWTRILREIDASILSTSFVEYHPVEFQFPAYLDETNPFILFDYEDRTVVNSMRSAAQRLKVVCQFTTTYHTTQPAVGSVFQFKPVDIVLRTGENSISEVGVLTDGATISVKVDRSSAQQLRLAEEIARASNMVDAQTTIDAYNNLGKMHFEFPASDPSTTEYKALMGTYVTIADDIAKWKYNLWRQTIVKMLVPDLDTDLSASLTYF